MEDNLTNANSDLKIDFNRQVFTRDLPDINNVKSEKIGIKLWKKSILLHVIWSIILFIIVFTVYFFINIPDEYALYSILGLIFYVFVSSGTGYMKYLSWKSMKYALREKDISFERGWFWNTKIVIPFNRIQHITVVETVIDKMFDIAQLNIFTAGGQNSELNIQGLDPNVAASIRDFVLRKTNTEDEEE